MALGIETGGFQLPQMQVAPADYSALAGMRPLQFGAAAPGPLTFQPTQQWQVPSAKQELVAQGIAEGASNALKTISAVYLDEQKAKREDEQLKRKLEAESKAQNLKWKQDLKMQQIKGLADMERAQIIHGAKDDSGDGLDEGTIRSRRLFVEELREAGKFDDANKVEASLRSFADRMPAVLPPIVLKSNQLIEQELADISSVGTKKSEKGGFRPVNVNAQIQTGVGSSGVGAESVQIEPFAPKEKATQQIQQTTDSGKIALSDILPFRVDTFRGPQEPAIKANASDRKENPASEVHRNAFDGVSIRGLLPAGVTGLEQLNEQQKNDLVKKFEKQINDRIAAFDRASENSMTSGASEDVIESIVKKQDAEQSKGKRYTPGIPVNKSRYKYLADAQNEQSRNYRGYGDAKIIQDPKTGMWWVEREKISDKSIAERKKQVERGLADLQVNFNKAAVIKPVAITQPSLIAFTEALKTAKKGGGYAKIADIDLIDQYIKVTKGGLVTESQYAQISGGGGGFQNFLMQAVNHALGGKLTDSERNAMRDTLYGAANAQSKQANEYIENQRRNISRRYPGLSEDLMPQKFPMYGTPAHFEEERDNVSAKIRALADAYNKSSDSSEKEKMLKEVNRLKEEVANLERERLKAENSGVPEIINKPKYPPGWPPYFSKGIPGDVSEVVSQSEN